MPGSHVNIHLTPRAKPKSLLLQCCVFGACPLLSLVVASFPGLQSPNQVEGLVKLLCRMTSGRCWVDVGRRGLQPCIYILALQFTGSAMPPT